MTDWPDTRADTTRQQILRAASHQFAKRPYYDVGIEDILAEAELTKGAMYFHFRSKYALALAIIEEQTSKNTAAVQDLLTRKLSGLETLVDVSYLIAVQDISQDVARAAFHLVETVGRAEGLQARVLGDWVQTLASSLRVPSPKATSSNSPIRRMSDASSCRYIWVCVRPAIWTSREQFLHHVENAWAER
jgi:TetR/AcrR family transcriptional regulator, transcriptional repressor for nem operon